MKNLKISTSEIAKICNVSQGTVDRALNNRTGIKAATKEKIIQVAKKFGYRDYVSIDNHKIAGQVGVIIFNLENEYFSELVTEIEHALRDENLGTVIMMSHYDGGYEIECIRNLYNMGVDGIILCSVNCDENFDNYLKLFQIPIVAVGNKVGSVPYVGIDDFLAMRDMTLNILKEQPQKIIYFSPALNYPNAFSQRKRFDGFLSAVGDARYDVVTDIEKIEKNYNEKTVIVCSNDYYALKVYFIGCNAKIAGFDNISIIDKYELPIDSVGYSMPEIAKEACNIIKTKSKDSVIIDHNIVNRTGF